MLIFFGAGIGGVLRYWLSSSVYWFLGQQFPYGTLVVNGSGSLFMGLLYALFLDRFDGLGIQLRSFFLIGLLGGYTTFATFSLETLNLLTSGAFSSAIFNILLNIIFCIALTWLGMIWGRLL